VILVVMALTAAVPAAAQTPAQTPPPQEPIILGPPPPPATSLEAFRAGPGVIATIGYDDLGDVSNVFVDVREMRDTQGARVRGVVVEVAGRQASPERAYIDADELSDLIKAVDTILNVTTNPTQFRSFDMRYSTKGELVVTASSTRNRGVLYGVEVGRVLRVRRTLNGGELHQLRTLFEAAQQKLSTLRDDRGEPSPLQVLVNWTAR
jgi:hypothetical protein